MLPTGPPHGVWAGPGAAHNQTLSQFPPLPTGFVVVPKVYRVVGVPAMGTGDGIIVNPAHLLGAGPKAIYKVNNGSNAIKQIRANYFPCIPTLVILHDQSAAFHNQRAQ